MTVDITSLTKAAFEARDKAHAPYSNHPVGVALLADNGVVYSGCNIENAAYPLGQCAEATAIGGMVLGGGKLIKHIVIVGPAEHACTPCGGCRQKIREFTLPEGAPVTICKSDGAVLMELSSAELLPHAFGPDNIKEVQV